MEYINDCLYAFSDYYSFHYYYSYTIIMKTITKSIIILYFSIVYYKRIYLINK